MIFQAKHLKRLALPTVSGHPRHEIGVCYLDESRPGLPPVALSNNVGDRRRWGVDRAGPDRTLAYSVLMPVNTPSCKTPNNSIGGPRTSARL